MKPYLVLDTNILLLDAENLLTLGKDYTIVLPETVLDEIESKKSDENPNLRYQVREFGRITAREEDLPIEQKRIDEHYTMTIVPSLIDGIRTETVSLNAYPEFQTARNDSRIIYVARLYEDLYGNVTFMTNDGMCKKRAKSYGLNVTDLKLVNTETTEFIKEVEVSNEVFSVLHNKAITSVDFDHKTENYNYIFTDITTGQKKLANVRNGYIDVLGKETEKELRRQDASPKNVGQLFMARAIQNPQIDIILCDAAAGTGKTLTAFSNAIQLVKRGEYKGITYIRTSVDDVEKAEENGFRSGNEEKDAPFFGPVEDTLGTIIRGRYKDNKRKGAEFEEFIQEQMAEAMIRYNIKSITTLGLRGRTFPDDEIVIVDEAQNYSGNSLQKTITRSGKHVKWIIVGSNRQIDHPYVTRHNSGLSILLEEARHVPKEDIKIYAVPLSKILRSPIAEFGERVFSKEKFK